MVGHVTLSACDGFPLFFVPWPSVLKRVHCWPDSQGFLLGIVVILLWKEKTNTNYNSKMNKQQHMVRLYKPQNQMNFSWQLHSTENQALCVWKTSIRPGHRYRNSYEIETHFKLTVPHITVYLLGKYSVPVIYKSTFAIGKTEVQMFCQGITHS